MSHYNYVGERQGDLLNSFTLPGYLRTDASVFYEPGGMRLALNVRNLFDASYYDSGFSTIRVYPAAPLTVQGTLGLQF
ncbi:TonB-dependent receptor [Gloeobacter morelensis]|uniref:TonB-dependent receptor n=1 Tax=Gloeobacter morelensis MG652769 TaxID=2781736 RepID=A0ABY3PJM2_9CYAN|nr:TonB-dependent receptor [Gloeobacter morelensis]UFP93847.1 TonB-dependent receptor [Gloeobacter morelensis MG652769]